MLYLGTSGFSYNDWVGHFYPIGLPRRDWLTYYAREFNTCEVNSTYYALPKPANMAAMADKTGDGFLFTIKAYQEITHRREDISVFKAFLEAIEPIIVTGKLGCILAQFPFSFRPDQCNWDYLKMVREQFGELPVVIEFRNAQWLRKEVFDLLRQLRLGFCCVDELFSIQGMAPRILMLSPSMPMRICKASRASLLSA
jgi:uncharacterized protein YecE (DUF72 family)